MTDLSPAPGTPQTAEKAGYGGVVAGLAIFLGALLVEWTDTDPLEARDFVVALCAAAGGGGLTSGVIYKKKNKPKA